MQKKFGFAIVSLIIILSLVLVSISCASSAKSGVEDFYKANTVKLLVPSAAGGGTDYAGRVFAAQWNKATGGNIIVENNGAGGGAEAVNAVYNTAKPDGLTLGASIFAVQIYLKELLKDPAVKWVTNNFSWIGAFADEHYAFALSAKNSAKTLDDVRKMKGFKFGSTRPEGITSFGSALTIDALGLQEPKIIMGMVSQDLSLAMGRGEIDGYIYVSGEVLNDIKRGYIQQPLFTLGIKRSEFFPNIPSMTEALKLTAEQEKLLKAFVSINSYKVIFGPPGIPEDKLQYLRSTFDKIVASEDFKKQAMQQWPILTPSIGGKEWTDSIKSAGLPLEEVNTMYTMAKKYSASK